MKKLVKVVGFNPDAVKLKNKLMRQARKDNTGERFTIGWHQGKPGQRGWAVFKIVEDK